jgi:hypothetical protein
MSAGSYRDAAKGGVHNLGGNIKEHTAACFSNGGAVRRYADGDSVMFGDAPRDDTPAPEQPDSSSYSSPGDSEQSMASDTAASNAPMSDADAKGGSSVDAGADSAAAPAPAKAAGLQAGINTAKQMYAAARKNTVVAAINRAGESIIGSKDPKAAAEARTAAVTGETATKSDAPTKSTSSSSSDEPKKKRGRGGVEIDDPAKIMTAGKQSGPSRFGPKADDATPPKKAAPAEASKSDDGELRGRGGVKITDPSKIMSYGKQSGPSRFGK